MIVYFINKEHLVDNNLYMEIYNCDKSIYIKKEVINRRIVLDIPYGVYTIKLYKNFICLLNGSILYNKDNSCYNLGYEDINIKSFILTDYNYPGLKIERGILNLWPIL